MADNSRIASLQQSESFPSDMLRNPAPAALYEEAICREKDFIASNGALVARSEEKTGRSPHDKRIVDQPSIHDDVWWGDVNIPLSDESFSQVRQRAIDYLDQIDHLYVIDAFAGWDPESRIKVRIISSCAYHALFMHNMLIRPTEQELENFGQPDYVIYNAGHQTADPTVEGVTSETCVAINFEQKEIVILGTEYAGEMKKGVFTVMNYLLPKEGTLSMHCSCNVGSQGDAALFFGLSGTGKTTLSADPERRLVGDDEHGWNDRGVFNIEGGCYAKCINLTAESEPQIFNAIRFGSLLENVVVDEKTREVDFTDTSITQNTRCSYPIEFVENALIPCVAPSPNNIFFLTCDAFGVLPPVSSLNSSQAMYHFISGYTAKVAGTEVGVDEPEATFAACFGAAFLVWHPVRYAELLAEKMSQHGANVWLINTGWTGGPYGVGSRIRLAYTRAIITAIHEGRLSDVEYDVDPIFGFRVPRSCPGVPEEILHPRTCWDDPEAFDQTARKLALKFKENFALYEDQASEAIKSAGPVV